MSMDSGVLTSLLGEEGSAALGLVDRLYAQPANFYRAPLPKKPRFHLPPSHAEREGGGGPWDETSLA